MMRTVGVLLVVAFSMSVVTAQTTYDASLSAKLEADENGMRTYVMAFLKAGPNRERPREEAQRLQAAHRANIDRLAAEGKLMVAGPFADDTPLRGIYIFAVPTVAEAEALTRTDPAIQAGQLAMELHPWYGSAALMMVPAVHATLQKPRP
jgi:uncharacterized protein YciI